MVQRIREGTKGRKRRPIAYKPRVLMDLILMDLIIMVVVLTLTPTLTHCIRYGCLLSPNRPFALGMVVSFHPTVPLH